MKPALLFVLSITLAGLVFPQAPLQPGDRVAIVGNTFADQLRVHGYLETRLVQHDPTISLRHLGWGGDTLTDRARPTNFPSETTTLTAHKTDVIIACFGMGESFDGLAGIDGFKQDLGYFIQSHAGKIYNGKRAVRLVLVSPIAYENLGALTPHHERRTQELAAYTKAMREVAKAAKLPFVDLFEPSRSLMAKACDHPLTTNGITLNATGYWAISKTFAEQLHREAPAGWHLQLDAGRLRGEASGVELGPLAQQQNAFKFSVTEAAAPSLPPPGDAARLAPDLKRRDTLAVKGLTPGNWRLTVDGKDVASGSHEAWANGIAVDGSPAHRETAALREAINDKNLQFTYSWKALNQVHIVGERKSSPSGRSLPKEVVAFDALAKQREQSLRDRPKTKTREWRLTPVND